MTDRLKKFISDNDLFKPGDKILLAVSGGIDSMVMCHLLIGMDIIPGIAHCNFQLRPGDSDKDEEMVRKYADERNIPFFSKQFETESYASANGLSIQMAARELRYKWFEDIRQENHYNYIAVAHNLNDNIETLLINLIRGTGISGLTGMKPYVNGIIRPLLFAPREDIMAYCNENQIKFREDASNADTKYTRNKIRHLVIPLLKEINPSIENTLYDTAERLTGINEIVTEYITDLKERVSETEDNLTTFSVSLLKGFFKNSTILFELFRQYGINNVQLNDLKKVIEGKTGGQIFTDSHRIIKNRKQLIVSPHAKSSDTFYYIEEIKDFSKIPGIESANYVNLTNGFDIPSDSGTACFDAEKISFPFVLRKWQTGDHFYPLGMKHKKKLSDYFIDNKYSRIEKEDKLILESAGNIIWIVGDRIDNRFRITKSTKKALIIKSTDKPLIIKPVK